MPNKSTGCIKGISQTFSEQQTNGEDEQMQGDHFLNIGDDAAHRH